SAPEAAGPAGVGLLAPPQIEDWELELVHFGVSCTAHRDGRFAAGIYSIAVDARAESADHWIAEHRDETLLALIHPREQHQIPRSRAYAGRVLPMHRMRVEHRRHALGHCALRRPTRCDRGLADARWEIAVVNCTVFADQLDASFEPARSPWHVG